LLQREAHALANPDQSSLPGAAQTLRGRVESAEKSADLLAPLIDKAAPELQDSLSRDFSALKAQLPPEADSAQPAPIDPARGEALATLVNSAAQDLDRVNVALGLEQN